MPELNLIVIAQSVLILMYITFMFLVFQEYKDKPDKELAMATLMLTFVVAIAVTLFAPAFMTMTLWASFLICGIVLAFTSKKQIDSSQPDKRSVSTFWNIVLPAIGLLVELFLFTRG